MCTGALVHYEHTSRATSARQIPRTQAPIRFDADIHGTNWRGADKRNAIRRKKFLWSGVIPPRLGVEALAARGAGGAPAGLRGECQGHAHGGRVVEGLHAENDVCVHLQLHLPGALLDEANHGLRHNLSLEPGPHITQRHDCWLIAHPRRILLPGLQHLRCMILR